MQINQIKQELISNLNEIKFLVDEINGLLEDLGVSPQDDYLYDLYMNFPTYDSIKELANLVETYTKGE